jgi:ribosomal protein S18 acetylase RimI-like enzyme
MPDVKITIRPATAGDLEHVVSILTEDPAPDLRAIVPDRRKLPAIGALLGLHGMLVGLDQTVLAEAEGEPVALMETLRSTNQRSLGVVASAEVVLRAIWLAGPGVLRRYLRLESARKRMGITIPPGGFDLNELDVRPRYRNQGIGSQLIAHAEGMAREHGCRQMWLTTESNNPATRLYARHGFRIERSSIDAVYEEMTGAPGRVLMLNDLALASPKSSV